MWIWWILTKYSNKNKICNFKTPSNLHNLCNLFLLLKIRISIIKQCYNSKCFNNNSSSCNSSSNNNLTTCRFNNNINSLFNNNNSNSNSSKPWIQIWCKIFRTLIAITTDSNLASFLNKSITNSSSKITTIIINTSHKIPMRCLLGLFLSMHYPKLMMPNNNYCNNKTRE